MDQTQGRLSKLRANPKHPIHRTWSFPANFPKKHYDSFTPRATVEICPRIPEDGGANHSNWGNRVPVISFMVRGVGSQVVEAVETSQTTGSGAKHVQPSVVKGYARIG